jgi:hypothetical protein
VRRTSPSWCEVTSIGTKILPSTHLIRDQARARRSFGKTPERGLGQGVTLDPLTSGNVI